MDDLSDSGHSSSSASQRSKHTISAEIVQLGESPIISSTIKQFAITLPITLIPAICSVVEFKFIGLYGDMTVIGQYAYLYPFIQIFVKAIPQAIAQSCANSANKNIVAGQYAAANVYFAYYFMACSIYCFLSVIVGLALIKPLYGTENSNFYILSYFVIFPFAETFTFAADKFFQVENRLGLVFMKKLISFITICGFGPFIYNYQNRFNLQDTIGLDVLAYVHCLDYVIQVIWSIAIISRKKVMDVNYFGVLKFSVRRLRPFRPKFLLNIYIHALSSILINIMFPLSVLIVSLIIYYLPNTDYELDLIFFKNMIVILFRDLLLSIHLAFDQAFCLIASYNIGRKKLVRTFDFIKWHLIFDISIIAPICIIFFFSSTALISSLLPFVNGRRSKQQEVQATELSGIIISISAMFGYPFLLSNALLDIEQKSKLQVLVQLPSLVYTAATPFISSSMFGETAPQSLVLALLDFINFMVGIPLTLFFYDRYKGLAKAEVIKEQQNASNKNKNDVVDEIRLTVTHAFAEDVEAEDPNQARSKMKFNDIRISMTQREKMDKLSHNVDFVSLSRQFGSSVNSTGLGNLGRQKSNLFGSSITLNHLGSKKDLLDRSSTINRCIFPLNE